LTQNYNRPSAYSSETDENGNDEYDSDAIDSGGEDDSSDIIFYSSIQTRKMPMTAQQPHA